MITPTELTFDDLISQQPAVVNVVAPVPPTKKEKYKNDSNEEFEEYYYVNWWIWLLILGCLVFLGWKFRASILQWWQQLKA